ncbi:uncharacterized protein JCM10292_005998 [Rhodotorula paludigena]|uniref:uncharacterized protein n=1 Tax=Rhodotorula paludigena TaxID=86838 RepID=UPI00316C18CD
MHWVKKDEFDEWDKAAEVHAADWIKVRVWPPVNPGAAYTPGTLVTFRAEIPERLQPFELTAYLRGTTEILEPASHANSHVFLSSRPSVFPLLGNTFLDISFTSPLPFTLRLPDAPLCACSGEDALPRSWEDENGVARVRYEVVLEGRGMIEEPLGWSGTIKTYEKRQRKDGGPDYQLCVPFKVTPRMEPPFAHSSFIAETVGQKSTLKPDLSVSTAGRIARLALLDQPLEDGYMLDSLKLIHRITTPSAPSSSSSPAHDTPTPPPSLAYTFRVSLGTHPQPVHAFVRPLQSEQPLSATFTVLRVTTLRAVETKPGLILRSPIQHEEALVEMRTTQRKVVTELRFISGAEGDNIRAEEVFLDFDGSIEVPRTPSNGDERGDTKGKGKEKMRDEGSDQRQEGLLPRVRSCNIEVRYDLVASFRFSDKSAAQEIRATDVRLDLPASLSDPVQRVNGIASITNGPDGGGSQVEVDAARFPALAALYGGTPSASSSSVPVTSASATTPRYTAGARGTAGAPLPPYEPTPGATPTIADSKDSLRAQPVVAQDSGAALPPPSYAARDESGAASGQPGAETTDRAAASERSGGRGSFASRFLRAARGSRSSAVSSEPNAAPGTMRSTATPAGPPPPVDEPAPVHEAPPTWEETVRDDMMDDWVAASVAFGGDDEEIADARAQ